MNQKERAEAVDKIASHYEQQCRDIVATETKYLELQLNEAKEAKDNAYKERDQLVAALSKLFPASLERHPDEDTTWENDWRWIVFIDLPTGQASWHIHDSELPLFAHLPRRQGRKWDGHSTPLKYKRLNALAVQYFGESA